MARVKQLIAKNPTEARGMRKALRWAGVKGVKFTGPKRREPARRRKRRTRSKSRPKARRGGRRR